MATKRKTRRVGAQPPKPEPKIEEKEQKSTRVGGMLADDKIDEDLATSAQTKFSKAAEDDLLNELAQTGGIEIAGLSLEKMSVAKLQLLERAKSMFIVGSEVTAVEMGLDQAMTEVAKFLYIMDGSRPISERARTVMNEEEFSYALIEYMDEVELEDCESVLEVIAVYIRKYISTMVRAQEKSKDLDSGNT